MPINGSVACVGMSGGLPIWQAVLTVSPSHGGPSNQASDGTVTGACPVGTYYFSGAWGLKSNGQAITVVIS